MKAIILGSNGYIGKHLAYYLNSQDWELRLYDVQNVSSIDAGSYQSLDVRVKEAVEAIDWNTDFIFYFAGLTGTANAYEQYENFLDINEKGFLHFLNAMRKSNSRARIIFPSTRLVYKGLKNTPLIEDAEKEFKTIYALNKWTCEQLLAQYATYFNLKYTVVRICIPYGTLFSDSYSYGTVGFFLSRVLKGEPISLYGNGSQQRTFTHVEDICAQILALTKSSEAVNNIFNIMGETYSLYALATIIAERYGAQVKLAEWPAMDLKLESGDTIFDGQKIKELTKTQNKHTVLAWIAQL